MIYIPTVGTFYVSGMRDLVAVAASTRTTTLSLHMHSHRKVPITLILQVTQPAQPQALLLTHIPKIDGP